MASLMPLGGDYYDPFSWDVWDPFDIGFGRERNAGRRGRRRGVSSGAVTVDWRETPDTHIFRVDVPGLKREEVKVQVEDGKVLDLRGERSGKEEEESPAGGTWHRRERLGLGSFHRRFRLPENADMDALQCSLDSGVLTLKVPKKEKAAASQPRVRPVEIS
ncbi:unnamed protein product [Spirodela intermedia]|uniref:SHSP domain-containing protein n=1 Tax=Spirodela intermedia TaxID=51605 RepID=A0A7I8KEC3_SPIIN|nr:unnamed protein product [Spirodela intermedia]